MNSTLNRTLLPDYDGVVYTLDAKLIGNIGRYFNHSCSPNICVQNVFVDVRFIF
jgi:SET domain-containing protein